MTIRPTRLPKVRDQMKRLVAANESTQGRPIGHLDSTETDLGIVGRHLAEAVLYWVSADMAALATAAGRQLDSVRWTSPDLLVVIASVTAIAAMAVFPAAPYNAYLNLAPNVPSPTSLVAIALLAVPAFTASLSRMDHASHHA